MAQPLGAQCPLLHVPEAHSEESVQVAPFALKATHVGIACVASQKPPMQNGVCPGSQLAPTAGQEAQVAAGQ